MGPNVTLLLAKTRGGFLNCHLFKNGGRGTKPTYIFLVIIPLLVIFGDHTFIGYGKSNYYDDTIMILYCNGKLFSVPIKFAITV